MKNHMKVLAIFALSFLTGLILMFGFGIGESKPRSFLVEEPSGAEPELLAVIEHPNSALDKALGSLKTKQGLRVMSVWTASSFLVVLMVLWVRRKRMKQAVSSDLVYENEMSLKLTLAQSYLEINDKENAVSLLQEITERGNVSEKEQARELLLKLCIE